MIRLGDIVDLGGADPALAERAVAGVAFDSRKVRPGEVFFALAGAKDDGLKHAADAVARGAAAIVAERGREFDGAPVVAGRRRPLSRSRAPPRGSIRDQPGTDRRGDRHQRQDLGRRLRPPDLAALGREAASLGTIGVVSRPDDGLRLADDPGPADPAPDARGARRAGVTHLAMEASSHGLDQKRLDGVRLAAGAFTNLSAATIWTTTRLSRTISPQSCGCSATSCRTARRRRRRRRRGRAARRRGRAGARASAVHGRREGRGDPARRRVRDGSRSTLDLEFGGRKRRVRLPLPGDFQISNALVAAGLCIVTGSRGRRGVPCAAGARRRAGAARADRRDRAAPRCSSITPTSPTRWKRRSRRCAPTSAAG